MAERNKLVQKTKWCVIVLICGAVVEMVVFFSIVIHWRRRRNETTVDHEQLICLPRDKFTLEGTENCSDLLREKFDEGRNTTVCCGVASLVFSKLVSKVVVDRYDSDTNPEISNVDLTEFRCKVQSNSRPTAKLVGLAPHKQPVPVGSSSKIFWNSEFPSFVKEGLTHLSDNGTLYVNTSGHFFIFSQIKVQLESFNASDNAETQKFRHYVHLISQKEGTSSSLLEDVRSPCEITSETSELTSGIGAVFKLEPGDRLYVATSHPERLLPDRINNFFSVLPI